MLEPICVSCQRFFRIKKSGFYFVEGMPNSEWDGKAGKHSNGWNPYKIWVGDLYECPSCKAQTVSGIGSNRLSEHYEPAFKEILDGTNAMQLFVKDC